MTNSRQQDLCQRYLAALESGDKDTVTALFSEDARIHSPLYGVLPADVFYAALFADTGTSHTQFIRSFQQSSDGRAIALQFRYRWTLADGSVTEFECADIFELAPGNMLFSSLTILYDTAPLRRAFDAVHNRGDAAHKEGA